MGDSKGKFVIVIILVVMVGAAWLSYSKLSTGVDNRDEYSKYDELNPKFISEGLVDEDGVLVVVVGKDGSPIWFSTEHKDNETVIGLVNRLDHEDRTLGLEYFGNSGSVVISSMAGNTPDRTKYTWRFYVNGETVGEGFDYAIQPTDILVFAVEGI